MNKNIQTVSDLIVRSLEAHGVTYVFGVPGEETEDLLFSLAKSKKITFIPTRHEQGAAFMANVWGRITGKAGICLSTLGPGATNLLTGLADAYLDKAPVVAITGQADSGRLHKESHQYIDVVGMFKPVTKWNLLLQNKNITREVISKAFKIAESEKPGVTHIDIPEDIAGLELSGNPIVSKKVRRGSPDYKTIDTTVSLLKKSKKPIILAGNGAIRKLASKQLRIFSEKYNIPVVSTFMGKGAISDKESRSLHTAGLKARDLPVHALEQADLVLSIGYDIAEYDPAYWNTKNIPIVHIDFSHAEVYEDYQPEIEIVADIGATLWELNRALEEEHVEKYPTWYHLIRKAIEKDLLSYSVPPKKLTTPYILSVLRTMMNDTDILISDVGSHKMWIGRNFPVYEPGTCIISNGLASMGISLPGGMAAKLARPDVRVVSLMGDGGFLMNSQEIETAKRFGVPYVILVVNDNDYGLITWKQTSHRGKSFGTKLTNPDFMLYAKSFGIKGYHPKNAKEFSRDIKKALTSNELCLFVVDIDPSVNMALSKKLAKLK